MFGSRWLLDELYRLGFGVSYNEVTRFKQACVVHQSSVLELPPLSDSQCFTHFIAYNVDHNVATLDGEGTFHGMRIIAATVGAGHFNTEVKLKRPQKLLKTEDILSKSPAVSIKQYVFPEEAYFGKLKLKPLIELSFPNAKVA